MKHSSSYKIGDRVKIVNLPPDLDDKPDMDTSGVFQRALGKTFRIEGTNDIGWLELEVTKLDTIWIEPEFVTLTKKGRLKK